MESKEVLSGAESRTKLLSGVNKLADAVKSTLGPRGRVVAIQRPGGHLPVITKDGVSVAREIKLSDPVEDLGAQLVRDVAARTVDMVGDGTTTSCVLAQAIYSEGARLVAAKHSPVELKAGIDRAVRAVIQNIEAAARPVDSAGDVAKIGAISANNDSELGSLIAEAMERVGKDGVIATDESPNLSTYLEVTDGMTFYSGYASAYFAAHSAGIDVDIRDAYVLVYDKAIASAQPLVPILTEVAKTGRALLIIADDIRGEALKFLAVNHVKEKLRVCAIKAPGHAGRKLSALEDIAVYTGATLISDEMGVTLPKATLQHLGQVSRAQVDMHKTTLIGGGGSQQAIDKRSDELRAQIAHTTSDFDREKAQERLARLSGGVAVLRIGAATQAEMKEKLDRIEDALRATRAAVEEGIVPGGGVAYLRAASALPAGEGTDTEKAGVEIVRRALEAPLRQIAANAGVEPAVVANAVKTSDIPNYGYDALSGEYVDMIAAGIIDPAKVVKSALIYAASVAGLMLVTDCVIVEADSKTVSTGKQ